MVNGAMIDEVAINFYDFKNFKFHVSNRQVKRFLPDDWEHET